MLFKIDLYCGTTSLEWRAEFINQKRAPRVLYCVKSIYWHRSKSYDNNLCSGYWDDTKIRTASLILTNLCITCIFFTPVCHWFIEIGMHTFGVTVNEFYINWDHFAFIHMLSPCRTYAKQRYPMALLPLITSVPVSGSTHQQCLRKNVVSPMPLEQFTPHR